MIPLLSLMNFSFSKRNISQYYLMGTITCIPIGDKLRNKFKNWRPITLLNSIYKFYSGKKHLPKLIGESQTVFVQNRFIGENTRLTLDILNESQFENASGLLILVDFEKAFDLISWDFISKILKIFNFSDQTVEVVKNEKIPFLKFHRMVIHQNVLSSAGDVDRGTPYPPTSLFGLWNCWECPSGPIKNLKAIR